MSPCPLPRAPLALVPLVSALALACGGGANSGQRPSGAGGTDNDTGAGGSGVSAGGTGVTSTGGTATDPGAGGSVTSGGTGVSSGGSSASGGTGASSGGSSSSGSGGGTSTGGPCTPGEPVAQTLAGYSAVGYNNASWEGSGSGSTVAANGSGYMALTTSSCPHDADMEVAATYLDKIFNGCFDECGDGDDTGHAKANVFDWNHTNAGWITAQVSSNLHWTGMWPPADGPEPAALIFWVIGAVGGEQDKFTVAVHSSSDTTTQGLKVPIEITTSWQRVSMPWADFDPPADANALVFQPTAEGEILFAIDQAYLSKTVSCN